MVDLRYHVASLAAVFIALVIGILVGVGLSSRGSVSNPERARLQAIIRDRDDAIGRQKQQINDLNRRVTAEKGFVDASYSFVMANRLRGKRIALVFVGRVSGPVRDEVSDALFAAKASPVQPLRALKVPIDPTAIDGALASRPAFARYLGDAGLPDLGRALAQQLVLGGVTPLWTALADELVDERSGALNRAVDGVVVVRTTDPQLGRTARFLRGFYTGLSVGGTRVVGVEQSTASHSAVPTFRRVGISSVDDVDEPVGQLAMVLLLGGARPGHYGIKPTAEDVLPTQLIEQPPASGG
jgi:hypothetical protein